MADIKWGSVTIEVPTHGQFKCSLSDALYATRTYSKRDLARRIAEAYSDGEGKSSTIGHWMVFDRWVLAVVYSGLQSPLN